VRVQSLRLIYYFSFLHIIFLLLKRPAGLYVVIFLAISIDCWMGVMGLFLLRYQMCFLRGYTAPAVIKRVTVQSTELDGCFYYMVCVCFTVGSMGKGNASIPCTYPYRCELLLDKQWTGFPADYDAI